MHGVTSQEEDRGPTAETAGASSGGAIGPPRALYWKRCNPPARVARPARIFSGSRPDADG